MQDNFAQNLTALRARFPSLAERVENFPAKALVRVLRTRDGGIAYGMQQGDKITPVTNVHDPVHRLQRQFDDLANQIADFTRPVLLVGLYPGNELVHLFDHAENDRSPHCPQPIHVIIDSTPCLLGFLNTWDARRIIESERVRLYWHEEIPAFVEHLRAHPEQPHIFTLISGAPGSTLDRILPPLAALVQERDDETARLRAENNAYYDALDDSTLAARISQSPNSPIPQSPNSPIPQSLNSPIPQSPNSPIPQSPKILIPTCSWSTFIQHSARDTAAAFGELGWETRVLNLDAMMTPYFLARQINEFKPDVFLFIDHLRYEAEDAYPRNMMFVSWVQDEMKNIHCEEAGRSIARYAAHGKRDLVVGYTDRLEKEFGYPTDRLVPLHIPANPRIFHPVTLTPEQRSRHACQVAFMSNVSTPTDQILERTIAPLTTPLGLPRNTLEAIHDHLWNQYRNGKTFSKRDDLIKELHNFPEFTAIWNHHPATDDHEPTPRNQEPTTKNEELFRLFYWRLNDVIYRHVVLEWLDELGVDLHLHGHGWENHPRFAKFAHGPIEHGPELNIAYQAATHNLHLNITPGMHQRLWEITTAGARPLFRSPPRNPGAPEPALMREAATVVLDDHPAETLSEPARNALADLTFRIALQLARENPEDLENRTSSRLEQVFQGRPEWIIPDYDNFTFTDKQRLAERLIAQQP